MSLHLNHAFRYLQCRCVAPLILPRTLLSSSRRMALMERYNANIYYFYVSGHPQTNFLCQIYTWFFFKVSSQGQWDSCKIHIYIFYPIALATAYGWKPKFVRATPSATVEGENCAYGPTLKKQNHWLSILYVSIFWHVIEINKTRNDFFFVFLYRILLSSLHLIYSIELSSGGNIFIC